MKVSEIVGQVNEEAIWSVQLNPRQAGEPYNLTVSVQTATSVLSDVLFGDVFGYVEVKATWCLV